MPRKLLILENDQPAREIVTEDGELVVGRAARGGLILEDRTVSRFHAVFRRVGHSLVVEDTGSTCGTFVNDKILPRNEPTRLVDGDEVRFGRVRVLCQFDTERQDLFDATREAAFAAQANARVIVVEGERVSRKPLARTTTRIGSAPHCEVRLRDSYGPPEQALIRVRDARFWVEPRSTAQPPLLGEQQTPVTSPTHLHSNSVVLLRSAQVLFLYDFEEHGEPIYDPLAVFSRRRLIRDVAARTGLTCRVLGDLCRDRRTLGQTLGECLVEKALVTPLSWRVLSQRLLSSGTAQATRWKWPWRRRS